MHAWNQPQQLIVDGDSVDKLCMPSTVTISSAILKEIVYPSTNLTSLRNVNSTAQHQCIKFYSFLFTRHSPNWSNEFQLPIIIVYYFHSIGRFRYRWVPRTKVCKPMSATFPLSPSTKWTYHHQLFLDCMQWSLVKSTSWADFMVVMAPT
jgi:hypothetical protein